MTGSGKRKECEVALWVIRGHESGESSGGTVVLFVFTDGTHSVPDPHRCIEQASEGRYTLYCVDSIELIGDQFRSHGSTVLERNDSIYPIVNQSGLKMSSEVAEAMAAMMIDRLEQQTVQAPDYDQLWIWKLEFRTSGEHQHRIRRLLRTLDCARTAVIRSFENKIIGVEDHKGGLGITWKSEPTESEKLAFASAWESEDEPEDNVTHVVK